MIRSCNFDSWASELYGCLNIIVIACNLVPDYFLIDDAALLHGYVVIIL